VRLFARSQPWRRLFFAACLPYIVVSVLVESLHVSTAPRQEPVAFAQVAAPDGTLRIAAPSGPCMHAAQADDGCPACSWLRLGRRLESGIALVPTHEVTTEAVAAVLSVWPDSPVPHPSLFRGPPRSILG
jgi:hypothetical protein